MLFIQTDFKPRVPLITGKHQKPDAKRKPPLLGAPFEPPVLVLPKCVT